MRPVQYSWLTLRLNNRYTVWVIKAIIFDCFGVLVGSGFKEIYRQAGGDLEKDEPFVDELLADANSGRISSREMHQRVVDRLELTHDEWKDFVNSREQPNLELLGYVKELKNDYKLAILSNANYGVLPRKLSPEQLALFDTTVTSAEVGHIKPAPEIYLLAAEQLGVQPEECVFIDDGRHFCEGAEAVGMKSIWYQDFSQFKRDLQKLLA